MHGFALNVTTDLSHFTTTIIPCGIRDRAVTSLARELDRDAIPMREIEQRAARHLAEIFEADLDWSDAPL